MLARVRAFTGLHDDRGRRRTQLRLAVRMIYCLIYADLLIGVSVGGEDEDE